MNLGDTQVYTRFSRCQEQIVMWRTAEGHLGLNRGPVVGRWSSTTSPLLPVHCTPPLTWLSNCLSLARTMQWMHLQTVAVNWRRLKAQTWLPRTHTASRTMPGSLTNAFLPLGCGLLCFHIWNYSSVFYLLPCCRTLRCWNFVPQLHITISAFCMYFSFCLPYCLASLNECWHADTL